MRKRTAKQLGTRHDLNYFKTWTRRKLALALLAACVPVLFLAWLGVQGLRGDSVPYSSGKMSRAHAVLGKQCDTCHANFVGTLRVGGFRKHAQDQACLTCHQAPAHHADLVTFTPTCGSCHAEHVGSVQLARTADQNCTQCHSDLKTTHGSPHMVNAILSFGKQHPEFAALKKPDLTTIAFNHSVHMKSGLLGPPGSKTRNVDLECSDCHRPSGEQQGPWRFGSAQWQHASANEAPLGPMRDSREALMGPISYDKHCIACHSLPFDTKAAGSVPHETPAVVDGFVRTALTQYLKTNPAAWRETEAATRRIPGVQQVALQAKSPDDWLKDRVASDETLLWGKTCKQCHAETTSPDAHDSQLGLPKIQPASMPTRWFSHSYFDHSAHSAVRCDSCHAAALTSARTSDVLIPGIDSCRSCHSGASNSSAESGCFLCHQYHDWQQRKPFKPVYTIPQLTGQAD